MIEQLGSLMKSNEELMAYALSLGFIDDESMLSLIKSDVIPIEVILGKQILFQKFIKDSSAIAALVFSKLREYNFQERALVVVEDVKNYIELAESTLKKGDHQESDVMFCILNVLVLLSESPKAKTSVK